ncbi:ribulokinase [Ferruginibacter sp. HRS2-29]|uniref:ribulokinase n=1 Tax=Ferruginibacter sp. HRS2-29 TaxID=2487334 RepID=UPI0020CDCF21|nr:ribulokinase [Ferruginibacter sp. HRS2-29]MCP9753454.1 ribulokinase [Ferruginibacter sp. HRS2-29]
MMPDKYVIGVDYGTDSVRAVLVNAANGEDICSSVFYYPRWKEGLYCNAAGNQFRQHPLDYLEGLEATIKDCITQAGQDIAANIVGISVDTTGSSPVAIDEQGTPLALLPEFADNPNAMFVLWKDHTSTAEAEEINKHAEKYPEGYLKYVGGIYSSEWFWAKLLHILRTDKDVAKKTFSFVEHCDWIPFVLTGGNRAMKIRRGVCSAGHKTLWAAEFGGLPPNNFFATLDPLLDGFTDRLFTETFTSDKAAGTISREWADKLSLPQNVVIGVGAFDCHMGAVGGQIEPYYLSRIVGTSTCDIMVAPTAEMKGKLIKGICGQVDGSVIPGMTGMEAGQSAFGDAYAWFKNLLSWPLNNIKDELLREQISGSILGSLNEAAAALPLNMDDVIAVDWLNGRRTPDASQELKGAFSNLDLGSNAPQLYKALVEATCFGSKAIVERFIKEGIPVKGIIALGGVAKKSAYIMQVMANILEQPIGIHKSEQTCALGAAMFAATAAGIYATVEDAMLAMGQGFEKTVMPDPSTFDFYRQRYLKYQSLGNFIEQTI